MHALQVHHPDLIMNCVHDGWMLATVHVRQQDRHEALLHMVHLKRVQNTGVVVSIMVTRGGFRV